MARVWLKTSQLDEVFSFINETALFKGQWQFKQGRMPLEEYQALVREKVRPIYEELKSDRNAKSCSFRKWSMVISSASQKETI